MEPQSRRKQEKETEEDLTDWSKPDLIKRIRQLESHVKQLRNVLAKKSYTDDGNKACKQKPFDFTKYNKRHVALKVAYLGWDYHGFTVQEDEAKTIEDALFTALIRTRLIDCRENSNYHRCGRTDKGVSAFSQVISIDLRSNFDSGLGVINCGNKRKNCDEEIRYTHILNKVLPKEIRVLAWAPVDVDFSARFSCFKRTYRYYFPKSDLDIEKMKIGCGYLIGEHDFRNLCKMDVGNGVVKFIRKITRAEINPITNSDEGGYQLFEFIISSQGFLWHQVRCIVAILFLIGQTVESPTVIEDLLNVEKCPRKPQYDMASELPLVLFDCDFKLEWIVDEESNTQAIQNYQREWSNEAIK
uniref:Pseudouridine synthase I TruA alpha/beta domain-containing protein n=1 Tax=Strigamia maritima TaxID=126957 RepID=T1J741_STRMM